MPSDMTASALFIVFICQVIWLVLFLCLISRRCRKEAYIKVCGVVCIEVIQILVAEADSLVYHFFAGCKVSGLRVIYSCEVIIVFGFILLFAYRAFSLFHRHPVFFLPDIGQELL